MGRALVAVGLWLLAAAGALATAFFVAMLLTPGYADAFIAACAAVAALVTAGAGALLRRHGRARRARLSAVVADVGRGRLLEQLPPSRRRWTLIALAAGTLTAGSALAAVGGSRAALLPGALVGVLLVLSLLQLVPGVCWLRVTTRGVLTRHLGRTRAWRWEDLDEVRAYEVSTQYTRQHLVGWRVADHARADRRPARWLRVGTGVDDGLPTEYGSDAEALAERLQRYRDEHVGASARPPGAGPARPGRSGQP